MCIHVCASSTISIIIIIIIAWILEWNGNKTSLNMGSGMEINHWEWEGMGLKDIPAHL